MVPTPQQLDAACDYLNVDKNQHLAAHGKWHLDPGKLTAAVESAGLVLLPYGATRPEDPKVRNERLKGEYFEEVEMFVDGIVEDITSGHLASQDTAVQQLREGVPLSRYVMDDELQRVVLDYSEHPTAFFHHGGKLRYTGGGKDSMPWQDFARDAFEEDCLTRLTARSEFVALPTSDPDENEEDANGEETAEEVTGEVAPKQAD